MKKIIFLFGLICAAVSCSSGCGGDGGEPEPEIFSVEIVPSDQSPALWQQVGFYLRHNGGNLRSAEWDFGDGTSAAGAAAEHSYTKQQTFHVSVKATSANGFPAEHMVSLDVSGRSMSKALKFFDRGRVWICAHRCNTGDESIPENSITALRACIRSGNMELVETDPRMTRDGVMVLMHDETVNRTTNGSGKVSDLTYEQIHSLRLKLANGTVTADTVPTLRGFLLEAKGKIFIDLDFINKVPVWELYSEVAACGMLDQAMFYTSNDAQAIGSLSGYTPPGIVFTQTGNENAAAYHRQGIYVTQISAAKILETNLGAIAAQNSMVVLSNALVQNGITIDDDIKNNSDYSGVDRLLSGGVNIIQTDQAPLVDAYLKSKNKR